MRRSLCIAAIWALVLLTLAACVTQPEPPPAPGVVMLLGTPVGTSAQATADDQAVATAEIMRANAQATLNSANATLSAAQTQSQNNADVIAAQIAAAAEIVRANAQATLVAANSTQSAALTQDAIRQAQAGTQTAVANLIATQTQSALATSQWYSDQSRQRQEQSWGSIASLWMWCLPIFVVLFAGLCLWGFWRWMKIQQDRQRNAEQPVEKLPAPVDRSNPQDRFLPPGRDVVDGRFRLKKPGEQMRGWLDEIKQKLLNRERDTDDNPDS